MTVRDFHPVLQPSEVAELVRTDPATRLLDVRTPGEFEVMHIRGAYNLPLDSLAEHAAEIRSSVAVPLVIVCQSGMRARKADEALRSLGMTNLHVLDGGVNGWVAAGGAVARGASKLSLERQVRIAAGALSATGGLLALLVDPLFAIVPALVGSGLVFAGVTNSCGMAMALSRLPYNRAAGCDVAAMVRALTSGMAPASPGPDSGRGSTPACAAG